MALTTAEQSGMIHGSDLQYLLTKIKGQFSDQQAYNSVSVNNTTNKFTFTRANGGLTENVTQANATTSLAGLMSKDDKSKLDGIASNANNYSLPLAASGTRGGVQIGYSASGKNYAIQLSNEKMYVNVPWEANTWRGITTALNNTSTTVSASASAVKALNDNKAASNHNHDGTYWRCDSLGYINSNGSTFTVSSVAIFMMYHTGDATRFSMWLVQPGFKTEIVNKTASYCGYSCSVSSTTVTLKTASGYDAYGYMFKRS